MRTIPTESTDDGRRPSSRVRVVGTAFARLAVRFAAAVRAAHAARIPF